jgi:hypothetical protein
MKLTIIAISSNTNAFGLRSHLLLSPDGRAWRALLSAYGSPSHRVGDTLAFAVSPDGQRVSRTGEAWECTGPIAPCSPATAAALIAGARRSAESLAS